jgi:hypothetical protein
MKCIYYLAPTLLSVHRISIDLRAAGVSDSCLHVVARDERGLKHEHIRSANYLETLDLIRDGCIGAGFGFLAGWLGIGLLQYFDPFGPDVPTWVYAALIAAATLFGAWEGGLTGIDSENKKIRPFHADIEAGKFLMLIYVRKHQEQAVRALMQKFPEAELVAIDAQVINPFSSVKSYTKVGPQVND